MSKESLTVPPQPSRDKLIQYLAAGHRALGLPVYLMMAILFVLMIIVPEQGVNSVFFTLAAFWEISPFLAISIALAAGLTASGADQVVARVFSASPVQAIIYAALFGAVSPFCSCGVVPLIAGMLVAGVPLAPVLAFCIASPIMDPEMFVLTYATLGLEFAVVKTLSAFAMGIMAGFMTLWLDRTGFLRNPLKPSIKASCCGVPKPDQSTPIDWTFWRTAAKMQRFTQQSLEIGIFLARWLAFAFLIESLLIAYVPASLVAEWLGTNNFWSLPLATVIGMPVYMNGYAAIPLIRGLIDLGMSPATGMAFILAGSVTSINAAMAVWVLFKPRLFALYVFAAMISAFMASLAYGMWL